MFWKLLMSAWRAWPKERSGSRVVGIMVIQVSVPTVGWRAMAEVWNHQQVLSSAVP